MKVLILLVLLLINTPPFAAADVLDAFGAKIIYNLPNNHWKVAFSQNERDKGIMMFYNDKYPYTDPELIDPALSIIYERVPENIKTAEQYADYCLKKNPFPPLSRKEAIGDRVLCCHRWKSRFKNNLIRIFQVQNGIGVQALGTVTAEKIHSFMADINKFIIDVTLNSNKTLEVGAQKTAHP